MCYAEDFFKPHLERLGYRGIFWPKACSPAEQYGYPCDGCALFYRAERLELIGTPQGETHCRAFAGFPAVILQEVAINGSSISVAGKGRVHQEQVCCACAAGQPFEMARGVNGKQGMLHAVLHDRHADCAIVAATTHLKAKAGQVGRLIYNRPCLFFSCMCSPRKLERASCYITFFMGSTLPMQEKYFHEKDKSDVDTSCRAGQ